MKFSKFLEESSSKGKTIVVYGGGFQPFHAGHMSSYEQAKHAFPSADFYVAASNDTKNRPIPFKDKQFLAQQAGVKDHFVQVTQPVNPTEILSQYNPKKDVLILVRSERDPVNYTKKDGSKAYYQPFKSLKDCVPFNSEGGHGYIFVTKKHTFKVNGKEVYSGSQVRSMYSKADDKGRKSIVDGLYPNSTHPNKVKTMLDKYIGNLKEENEIDGLFEEILEEGVHDKGIFKAVFLAGGPGSGKDYVLDNTLAGHGMTEINSDKALEFLMDKKGLNKTMPASEKIERDVARGKAKNMTELRQRLALHGRNGLIINGTGDDAEKIKKIKTRLDELGYDSAMIMVNTRDEVSASRNVERGTRGGRTVPETVRKQKWDSVQNSRTELAKLFGDKYVEFDNSEDLRSAHPEIVKAKKDELLNIYKGVQKFIKTSPKAPQAKEWIGQELEKSDTLPVNTKTDAMPHPNSGAAEEARQLGLQYYGFGRYGKEGKVTHRSVHDKLQQVKVDVPKTPLAAKPVAKKVNEEFENEFANPLLESALDKFRAAAAEREKKHNEIETKRKEDAAKGKENMSGSIDRLEKTLNKESHEIDHKNLLKDHNGKVKTFMLRRSAAKEAHINGGVVYKQGKGYVIKIKENEDVKINQKIFQESGRTNTNSSTGASGRISEADFQYQTGSDLENNPVSTKITLNQIRTKKESKIKEAIDMGIEPGMSMAAGGESIGRDMGEKIKKRKIDVTEMQGDETTASIGDQKEDELKKKGIDLLSFRKRNYAL